MKRVIVAIIIMAATSLLSYGQRMMPKQFHLSSSVTTLNFSSTIGGEIMLGQYTRNGRWSAGLDYRYSHNISNDIKIPVNTIIGKGGYEFTLLSNYKKTIVLAGGLRGLIGYEDISKPEEYGIVITNDSSLIYGFAPVVSFDFFFHRYISICVFFEGDFAFGSSLEIFRPLTGVGLRFVIN